MEGILALIGIIFVASIIDIINAERNKVKKQKEIITKQEERNKLYNNTLQFSVTNNFKNIIEVDEKRNLFRVAHSELNIESKIYKYSDILDFKIMSDDNQIETTGGLGSAALGGLLFGNVGAIVGGTTGKRISKKVINKLQIKITLNDIQNPTLFVNLNKKPFSNTSIEYKNIIETAEKTISILSIIKNNHSENSNNFEEISKYKKLFDDGIISQEEFNEKKKELLNL